MVKSTLETLDTSLGRENYRDLAGHQSRVICLLPKTSVSSSLLMDRVRGELGLDGQSVAPRAPMAFISGCYCG